ncbi:MAG: hypothetical protein U1E14_14525 [Geminicoccaceae bacterium]
MHDQHDAPGVGHNHGPRRAVQWQTPHLPHGHGQPEAPPAEPDLDLVEAAFAEGFVGASDPTSFLRLAGVPFTARAADGHTLSLLRVELGQVTDIGSLTPVLGGGGFRYDPLPARLVGRRRRVQLVYFDGHGPRPLTLAEARALGAG